MTGYGEVELLPGWSLERAQKQAQQLAILDALQKAFPTEVARTSKYIIQNRTQGGEAQTQTFFHLTADQYLGGEWLQTLEVRYQTEVRKGSVWVSCKIRGRARPRTQPLLPLEVRTLRCRDTACTTTDFLAGDPLYLRFRSPIAGYLQVFWEEAGRLYRLLPYQNQRQQAWPIRPDTTYLSLRLTRSAAPKPFPQMSSYLRLSSQRRYTACIFYLRRSPWVPLRSGLTLPRASTPLNRPPSTNGSSANGYAYPNSTYAM